uniref:Zinc finger FYVE domain-containing protein 9-like protein MW n=1 Tax=Saccoglossus kowalevskii TaxID=10224 RepID=A0A1L7H7G3_SACKO|nr:zinc finger FYVE domain-containing protein 9-like protein MW [Saccoglossus kowalevskii]
MASSFFAQADDIDSLLDEFEKNEDSAFGARKLSGNSQQNCYHDLNGVNPPDSMENSNPMERYGLTFEPADLLDLSEADFAPALSPIINPVSGAPKDYHDGQDASESSVNLETSPDNTVTTLSASNSRVRTDSNSLLGNQDFSSFLPTNLPHSVSLENLQSVSTNSKQEKSNSDLDLLTVENPVLCSSSLLMPDNHWQASKIPPGLNHSNTQQFDSLPHPVVMPGSSQPIEPVTANDQEQTNHETNKYNTHVSESENVNNSDSLHTANTDLSPSSIEESTVSSLDSSTVQDNSSEVPHPEAPVGFDNIENIEVKEDDMNAYLEAMDDSDSQVALPPTDVDSSEPFSTNDECGRPVVVQSETVSAATETRDTRQETPQTQNDLSSTDPHYSTLSTDIAAAENTPVPVNQPNVSDTSTPSPASQDTNISASPDHEMSSIDTADDSQRTTPGVSMMPQDEMPTNLRTSGISAIEIWSQPSTENAPSQGNIVTIHSTDQPLLTDPPTPRLPSYAEAMAGMSPVRTNRPVLSIGANETGETTELNSGHRTNPVTPVENNLSVMDAAASALEGLSVATAATMMTSSTQVMKPSDVENLRLQQRKQHSPETPEHTCMANDTGAEGCSESDPRNTPPVAIRQNTLRQNLRLDFNHAGSRKVLADYPPPSETLEHANEALTENEAVKANNEVQVLLEDEHSTDDPAHSINSAAGSAEQTLSAINSEDFQTRFNVDLPEGAFQLGNVAPLWVPDPEAPNCMMCSTKFTFTKRRHHCRACGKVFCSNCCNIKTKLKYMDNKEARVCVTCNHVMLRVEAIQRMNSPGGGMRSPNPNNPSEYCSTVPPLEQARSNLNQPPPSVMVPVSRSVLRRPNSDGSQRQREPRHVRFSDGIHPGGDLTDDNPSSVRIRPARTQRRVRSTSPNRRRAGGDTASGGGNLGRTQIPSMPVSLIPKDEKSLPPVIINTGTKGEYTIEENPNQENILGKLSNDDVEPIVFALNKNLFVMVKIIDLDCCVNRRCWCFTTKGMPTAGQDEMVIVLECLPEEKTLPRDVFCHFNTAYEEASKGNTVTEMGHTIFTQGFLGSREHGGFLYIRPSFQCVRKLLLPDSPYLFGVLLQKWETPWAKVFPVRLMLRLGAEFRYYPCPLMSVRFRKPVYGEVGHTIMNLLADFKNYQYMLPQIKGVTIHMQDRQTSINFPKNRYDDIMKVLNNSNEHVMAMGSNFSSAADSHLVCIQNDDGHYQTQAINIQNKPRRVTGASFVVFNGALKSSSGLTAKSSIVEDGLMVQIPPDTMTALRQMIRDMKDFTISCGAIGTDPPEESVFIKWVEDDRAVNIGVVSPIDGKSMETIDSIRIQNSTDYMGENKTIRWTEVFFLQSEDSMGQRCDTVDLSRLAETLAEGCCAALAPHLDGLKEIHMSKIGLRVTIDSERVGYEIGSNGKTLPSKFMKELDNHLIPVITNAVTQQGDGPVILELIFYILD